MQDLACPCQLSRSKGKTFTVGLIQSGCGKRCFATSSDDGLLGFVRKTNEEGYGFAIQGPHHLFWLCIRLEFKSQFIEPVASLGPRRLHLLFAAGVPRRSWLTGFVKQPTCELFTASCRGSPERRGFTCLSSRQDALATVSTCMSQAGRIVLGGDRCAGPRCY